MNQPGHCHSSADAALTPLVVLGCKLAEDGTPGPALTRRLATALPYALDPGRTVIVTGLDEAPAMATWLRDRGVPAERIIEENTATSTNENLERCHALVPPPWKVVTSDFHKPRVELWARHHNFEVEVLTAPTPRHRIPVLWPREAMALAHSASRMVWRRYKRVKQQRNH